MSKKQPERSFIPTNPWENEMFQSLHQEMNRVFQNVLHRGSPMPHFACPTPVCDLVESDKSFTIHAELPGMSEKDVEISISGNSITIEGQKQEFRESEHDNYLTQERSIGHFKRTVRLPDSADMEKAEATAEAGVLTITIPKEKKSIVKPKKLSIKKK